MKWPNSIYSIYENNMLFRSWFKLASGLFSHPEEVI
jgi:hypothetical protein